MGAHTDHNDIFAGPAFQGNHNCRSDVQNNSSLDMAMSKVTALTGRSLLFFPKFDKACPEIQEPLLRK